MSRSRSRTKKISINTRGIHSDGPSSAQSDPTANHNPDASQPNSENASNSEDMHFGHKPNMIRGKPTGCHFDGSYLFTFPGLIQCTCLVIQIYVVIIIQNQIFSKFYE